MTATSLRPPRRLRSAAFLLAALGCGGSDLIAPSPGNLQVTAATSGNPADLDQDGYTVAVDGGAGKALPINGSVSFSQLAAGNHTVALSGVAPNCTVSGQNPAQVTVTAGATAHSAFQIACAPLLALAGQIAFVSDRDGNAEIYVMDANGAAVTRVTSNVANDAQPAWSPDGTKLAFVSDRDGNDEIYVMNADGSGVTRLTSNPAFDDRPAWSPDGTKIAFQSNRVDHTEIYVMNANGSGVTRLTNNLPNQCTHPFGCPGERAPAWSPDGTKIAFVHRANDFGSDLDVMNADGSSVTRLTNAGGALRLAWSPDGTKIAFDPLFRGREIYLANVDGSGVTQLTHNVATDVYPAWSPDGTKIAFESDRDGNGEIYVMNADGSGVTRLTHNATFDGAPAWGP